MHDVYPNELIEKVAENLKKIEQIKPPAWAAFAKTGMHRERAPVELDWWYKRAAAVLRSVAILGPIGVSKLRTKYGGKKRRGYKPPEFRKGSGSIIRKILQQLEKAGFIKYAEKGVHKGRVITAKGMSLLDKTAIEILKTKPKPQIARREAKAEEAKEEKQPAEKAIESEKAKPKRARKAKTPENEQA